MSSSGKQDRMRAGGRAGDGKHAGNAGRTEEDEDLNKYQGLLLQDKQIIGLICGANHGSAVDISRTLNLVSWWPFPDRA